VTAALRGAVHVAPDAGAVAAETATWLAERCAGGRTRPESFSIALAGGSTPRVLYELIAEPPWVERFDWAAWQVYFGDERACPPDDPASNYRLARESLLSRVAISPDRVHRMRAEASDLDAAAAEYSQLLAATLPPGPGGAPRLDCVLLGLGENAHTASLFPGTRAVDVVDAWATRGVADYAPFDRITLTYPVLNAAAAVAFHVVGASKGEALRATIAGNSPAARVRPVAGELHWFLDATAAAELR
jgi:6-phosphogluconolactonase